MKRKCKRRMAIVLGSIGLIICLIIIYFNISYSRFKAEWDFGNENLTYFDGKNIEYKF